MQARHTPLLPRVAAAALLALAAAPAAGQYDDPDPNERPGRLRFLVAAQERGEPDGAFTVEVERTGGDDGTVGVAYATADGSATAGSDYTPRSGTLTWQDGDAAPKRFTVPILDDGIDESDETINVTLSAPTGGAELSAPTSATLTVRDDDGGAPEPGTIAFGGQGYQGREGDPPVTVRVVRDGGSDGAVSVAYATVDGSARAGSDYAAASGTLHWADGQTGQRTFTVAVVDDAAEEASESLGLVLSGPTGGAALGRSTASMTIVDDDGSDPPDPPPSDDPPADDTPGDPLPDDPTGPCVEDAETLCLGVGDRFRARIAWERDDGTTGRGRVSALDNRDSGLFTFFNAANVEMLLKVLNGCGITGEYWVFYAATTNVGFTLVVDDTVRETSERYVNPIGRVAATVLDTEAFDTCP